MNNSEKNMQSQRSYVIRKANRNDVEAMTNLHCESFRAEEHVPVLLGKRYVRATYRWLVSNQKSYALVAEEDKKIIGLVAVCDEPFTRPMFIACFPELICSIARNPMLLFRKSLWNRLFRRPDVSKSSRHIVDRSGFAQMTIGAVDKNIRGRGVFPDLVEKTKNVSRVRGSRAIRAGVYKTNQPSRRVFVKGGWIETPELETEDTVFYIAYLDDRFPLELGIASAVTTHEKIV